VTTRVSAFLRKQGLLAVGIAAVVLSILGGRWALLKQFGSDVPEWDQWEAEGAHVLTPWLRGEPLLEGILKPHNEHRVALTKVLNLAITAANGHWDQRLQATLNAFLPAAIGALLLGWAWSRLPRIGVASLALLLVTGLAGPLAWQNVLAGFHSQQFLLILGALAVLSTLPFAGVGSKYWWLGAAAACLSLVTMATGFVAATLAGAMLVVRLVLERRLPKREWVTLAFCSVITLAGFLLRQEVPGHDALRAHTLDEVRRSLWANVCWLSPNGFWGILSWTPFFWLAANVVKRSRATNTTEWVTLLVGLWALLHIGAAAVIRGGGGAGPASRYLDTQVIALLANCAALSLVAGRLERRWLGALAVAGWTTCFVLLAAAKTRDILKFEMPWIPQYRAECEQNVRDYLVTRERLFLERGQIPYPAVDGFLEHLKNERLLGLMPASVRAPLAGFEPERRGSFVSSGQVRAADYRSANTLSAPGLPPGISRLGPEETWGSFGAEPAGEWRSRVLQPLSGGIRMEVAGTWKDPDVSLEIQDASTGLVLRTLRPAHPTTQTWQRLFAPSPSVPFVLFARDRSENGWIAFSAPRHEAPLSRLARLACHDGRFALASGIVLLVLFLPALAWPERPSPTNARAT
jgi:hypothetical protein